MLLTIHVIGSKILRETAVDIDKSYPELRRLIDNMFETMDKSEGVGLAAPQVGSPINLFVVDTTPLAEDDPTLKDFRKVFINANIIEVSGDKYLYNEGCLSVPGYRDDVERHQKILIEYLDQDFNYYKEYYDGIKARVIQHEYDHIKGVLFVDRLSTLKKQIIRNKLKGIASGRFNVSYKTKIANI